MTDLFITEGDEGYEPTLGKRGKDDNVSPVLNPKIEELLANGGTSFQMKDKANGGPFTIAQVRYWQPRGNALLPEGKRIMAAGGRGKNIHVSIVDGVSKAKSPDDPKTPVKPAAKVTPKKRPPAKRNAAGGTLNQRTAAKRTAKPKARKVAAS